MSLIGGHGPMQRVQCRAKWCGKSWSEKKFSTPQQNVRHMMRAARTRGKKHGEWPHDWQILLELTRASLVSMRVLFCSVLDTYGRQKKKLKLPSRRIELRFLRPQRSVLATILRRLGWKNHCKSFICTQPSIWKTKSEPQA